MKDVLIKRGNVEISLTGKDFRGFDETHDGICFNFKGDSHFYITDHDMPGKVKKIISNFTQNLHNKDPKSKIVFDLNNYNNPVSIIST